jgi:hypothetical protein
VWIALNGKKIKTLGGKLPGRPGWARGRVRGDAGALRAGRFASCAELTIHLRMFLENGKCFLERQRWSLAALTLMFE